MSASLWRNGEALNSICESGSFHLSRSSVSPTHRRTSTSSRDRLWWKKCSLCRTGQTLSHERTKLAARSIISLSWSIVTFQRSHRRRRQRRLWHNTLIQFLAMERDQSVRSFDRSSIIKCANLIWFVQFGGSGHLNLDGKLRRWKCRMKMSSSAPCFTYLRIRFCVSRFLLCAKVAFRNKSCGGGQVVSVLAFHTEDPSSNPAEAYSIFCTICVWK